MITQKIDKNDGVLGVYHEWVKEIAKRVDKIKVICLYKGDFDLPGNVEVYSLGKERGGNKLTYIINFYRILFEIGFNYKTVFVHMNPEYLLLAGFMWRFLNKKIVFWYNHPKGGFMARLGFWISNLVLATSPNAYAYKNSKKTILMPVGINIEGVSNLDNKDFGKFNILYLGRISPVKNLDVLIRLGYLLKKNNFDFKLTVVGSPVDRDEDIKYFENIKRDVSDLNISESVEFISEVPQKRVVDFYRSNNFFINVTDKGSMDKTIFEAMAQGCFVFTSNTNMNPKLPDSLENYMKVDKSAEGLYSAFIRLSKLNNKDIKDLVFDQIKYTRENHSLDKLVEKLVINF